MSEQTDCPKCGAPAIVHIPEHPDSCAITFEYNDPELAALRAEKEEYRELLDRLGDACENEIMGGFQNAEGIIVWIEKIPR